MIEIVKFIPMHLDLIHEQEATACMRPHMAAEHTQALASLPHSYTVLSDGRPIACGGLVEYWNGRAEAWAVLDAVCKKDFIAVHNAARRFLDSVGIRRIEAVVHVGFDAGHRWLRTLGFVMEAPLLESYDPDGRDYSLYARVM